MFTIETTRIPGCIVLHPVVREDDRGRFVKTAHATWFAAHGLHADFREQYYSVSHQGVVRGLHFQTPPHDHAKLVYCVRGAIFDAVVDLRVGSPTYRQHITVRLAADTAAAMYVPPGAAHGFLAETPDATVVYSVTTEYNPDADRGVLWSSADIAWPTSSPVVSARDAGFPPLTQFDSPFVFDGGPRRPPESEEP